MLAPNVAPCGEPNLPDKFNGSGWRSRLELHLRRLLFTMMIAFTAYKIWIARYLPQIPRCDTVKKVGHVASVWVGFLCAFIATITTTTTTV